MLATISIVSSIVFVGLVVAVNRRSKKKKEATRLFGELCALHNEALRAGVEAVDVMLIMSNAATLRNQGDVAELKNMIFNFNEVITQVRR
ncbi:hypothetical protein [Vibrio phage vB_VneS_J26]